MLPPTHAMSTLSRPAAFLAVMALLLASGAQSAGPNTGAVVNMFAGDCTILRDTTNVLLPINLNNCNPPPSCTVEDFPGWRNPERRPGIFCSVTGRVTVIVLENNRVFGELPKIWGQLFALRVLVIPGNRASSVTGTVPPAWALLFRLTDLDLGGNQALTGAIPNTVLSKANLQYVRVAYSGITGNVAPYARTSPGVRMTLVVKGQIGETPEICGFPAATVDVRRMDPVTRQLFPQVLPVCPGSFGGFGRRMLR